MLQTPTTFGFAAQGAVGSHGGSCLVLLQGVAFRGLGPSGCPPAPLWTLLYLVEALSASATRGRWVCSGRRGAGVSCVPIPLANAFSQLWGVTCSQGGSCSAGEGAVIAGEALHMVQSRGGGRTKGPGGSGGTEHPRDAPHEPLNGQGHPSPTACPEAWLGGEEQPQIPLGVGALGGRGPCVVRNHLWVFPHPPSAASSIRSILHHPPLREPAGRGGDGVTGGCSPG